MNLKVLLSDKNQQLLEPFSGKIENREYSLDEITNYINQIGDYVMSKSSKNGDLAKEFNKYNELNNILIRYEKQLDN